MTAEQLNQEWVQDHAEWYGRMRVMIDCLRSIDRKYNWGMQLRYADQSWSGSKGEIWRSVRAHSDFGKPREHTTYFDNKASSEEAVRKRLTELSEAP